MAMKKSHLVACLGAMLALVGCVVVPEHASLLRAEPVFWPHRFFAGHTQGRGSLDVILSDTTEVQVGSFGWIEPDGTLVLEQRIERGNPVDRPPENRTWRLRTLDGKRVAGTLSSAQGPVIGEIDGNRLHLHFESEGGLDIEQWLYLQPGGQVAINRMVVRKFGLPVAALEETIRRVD